MSNIQPKPGANPNIKDSVVQGGIHTENVVHNHYHSAPVPLPAPQQPPIGALQNQNININFNGGGQGQQGNFGNNFYMGGGQQQAAAITQPHYPDYWERQHAEPPMYYGKQKDTSVAYLLWLFLGLFGAHRFYLNDNTIGIIYLFTFGLMGFGWFIDLFLIPDLVRRQNMR
jgi:hypothetical protein